MKQRKWKKKSHEWGVEEFYAKGAENINDWHGGYLNFGLWDPQIDNYVSAAEHLLEYVADNIDIDNDSKLLDVACGTGAQDVFLNKKYGCKIDAIDLTWKHVLAAKSKTRDFGDITIHHGNAIRLPFADESFTHVMCIEGAEHFNTREKFLKEANRVLQYGGKIGLSDYCLRREPKNIKERALVEITRKLWHVPKANYENVDTYKKMMERCGFKNMMVEMAGAKVIVGYYKEQRKKQVIEDQRKIRGYITSKLAFFIDFFIYQAYKHSPLEYIFATAEK